MDQDAFRALLSTPRTSDTSSTRAFGRTQKRTHELSAPVEKSTTFKPRAQPVKKAKVREKQSEGTSGYVDRAALRRAGAVHEWAGVDELKATLDARDAGEVDDQYLGGDAEHSVLVKGLDHSLLAQTKAKQAAAQESKAEAALDDLLDAPAHAPASAPSSREDEREEKTQSKKRSREERIADLQNKLKGEPVPEEAFRSKFRKVGEVKVAPAAVTEKKDAKGKKLRKKKKVPAPAMEAIPVQETPAQFEVIAPAKEQKAVVQEEVAEVEEEFDIFAGAAEYGASSSSDSEDAIKPSSYKAQETAPSKGWFDDDETEIHADPISAPVLPKRSIPIVEDSRLKGYEGSIDVKGILEADRQAEKEEKRKERKMKYAKPVEGEPREEKKKKKLTDADKLNRDHQELEAYWKKKGGKEKEKADEAE